MPANYLEQLVAEWYEYQGYFVRKNVLVGKRAKGGYECELDIVAFHPVEPRLVHVEPSMDALSWAKRDKRFRKKFEAGRKHIPHLFHGFKIPEKIEQFALLGFASKQTHDTVGGAPIVLVGEFLEKIFTALRSQRLASNAIPENLPILRSFQVVSDNRDIIARVWGGDS